MTINKLFKDLFREKKLRATLPRLLVYQELSKASGPLSIQELYRRLLKSRKRIGLTSIYRALDLFESIGIVFKISDGSNARYRLCESQGHHHHIVCKTCGDVVEFSFCNISSWSKKVTETTGYQVTGHQLSLYGLCRACRREN